MDITLIWAEFRGTIAIDGSLPVHLPEDLKFFKEYTMGKVLVMGRKTVESLPKKLEGRTVICLTRDETYEHPFADTVAHSVEEVLDIVDAEELVVAGGREIYDLFMDIANKVVKTRINHTLIRKKEFDKMKNKLYAPDIAVKGEFDSAEVLEKTNKMVAIRYSWSDEAEETE